MARPMAVIILLVVISHSSFQTSLLPFEVFGQTEQYTAWPRDMYNDTILLDEFPWVSCNSVTGENCPGVVDVLRHVCVAGDAYNCEKGIGKRNLLRKHVVLNLRPGLHRVRIRNVNVLDGNRRLIRLANFWHCNFTTLTIKGSRDYRIKTEIMALAERFGLNGEDEAEMDKCTWTASAHDDGTQPPSWTAFAFYGGANLIIKDLTFRPMPEPNIRILSRTSISMLNVPSVELNRCRFHMESPGGAMSFIYTREVSNFAVVIQKCQFNLHLCSYETDDFIDEWYLEYTSPVAIASIVNWQQGRLDLEQFSQSNKGNVTIKSCNVWSNYTGLEDFYRNIG